MKMASGSHGAALTLFLAAAGMFAVGGDWGAYAADMPPPNPAPLPAPGFPPTGMPRPFPPPPTPIPPRTPPRDAGPFNPDGAGNTAGRSPGHNGTGGINGAAR